MFVFQRFRYRARPMIQASATLAVLLGASLLVACAAPGGGQPKAGSGLETWLKQDVYPHLRDRFEHPRLKGQPFIVVAMDGDDTLAEIDELRAWVRREMRAEFMQTPGVNMVWRPTVKPLHHQRSLAERHCTAAAGGEINVQIGIDAGIDSLSGDLKVSIAVFDLQTRRPVTGFSPPRYRGRLSERERELLDDKNKKTDEYLRGLRPLPFAGNEVDLLASYLAQNLSCLLSRLAQGRLRLYAPPPQGAIPRVFANTFNAIDNYLGQLREVTITDNPRDADVHLQSEIIPVDRQQGIYQVWVDVRQTDDSRLGGSQTNAYVRLSAAEAQDIVRIDPPAGRSDPRRDLIASVAAVTAARPSLCRGADPWRFGDIPVPASGLSSGACFALKVRLAGAAAVSLFGQNRGQIVRVHPDNCAAPGALSAGQELRMPRDGRVLRLDEHPGTERFHVVAVAGEGAAALLEQRLPHIPCRPGSTPRQSASVADFERAMRLLAADARVRVDYKTVEFAHY